MTVVTCEVSFSLSKQKPVPQLLSACTADSHAARQLWGNQDSIDEGS